MPSNKEIVQDILRAAEKNGTDAPKTDGLSNIELLALLKDVNENDPTNNVKSGDDEDKPPFYIKDGKSLLCTGKGPLNEGEEIKADWLPGGKDRLAELIKLGVVAKG